MPSSPHILWLDPADFLGGAELFSLDVLPLLKSDFEITVLTNHTNSEFTQKLPPNIQTEIFELPRLKPITPPNIWNFFQTAKKLAQLIRENTFHLVHTNSIRAHILASHAIKKIPKAQRPKLTFFVHDFTFSKWAVQIFSRNAQKIFAPSQSVKNDLVQKGIFEKNISVIPNGIDTKKFEKIERKKFQHTKPIIGILGRIDPWKGHDIFLQSAQRVLQKYPNAQFKIFGKSSDYDQKTVQFEHSLKNFAEQNNLSQNIEFCGFTAVEKAFSNIDILVHASTAPEPFGRVIIEALAAGVPIIASNLGGSGEIFTNGIHGFSISPKNPELLAAKIRELIENETLRQSFSENGKKLVAKNFSLPTIVERIQQEWKKVLKIKSEN